MVVIPHQADSPDAQVVRKGGVADHVKELAPVLVVVEDRGFAIASGHDVVHGTGEL
jgi:hypothetical protein